MEERMKKRERGKKNKNKKKKKELGRDLTGQSRSVPESLVEIYEPVQYLTSKNSPRLLFSPRSRNFVSQSS